MLETLETPVKSDVVELFFQQMGDMYSSPDANGNLICIPVIPLGIRLNSRNVIALCQLSPLVPRCLDVAYDQMEVQCVQWWPSAARTDIIPEVNGFTWASLQNTCFHVQNKKYIHVFFLLISWTPTVERAPDIPGT